MTQPTPPMSGELQTWRQHLIRQVLNASVVAGALAAAGAAYDAVISGVAWQVPIVLGAYGLLLAVALLKRAPYAVRAGVVLALLYGLGLFNLLIAGQTGSGFLFLLAVPVSAALFFGRWAGILSLAVAAATLGGFGWAFVSGFLAIPAKQLSGGGDFGSWLNRGVMWMTLALLLVLPLNYLLQRLVEALGWSRELAGALDAQRAGLEEAVAERTAALARRSTQLETAAQVARDASGARQVDELMGDVARLISDRFGFYHTGIFLVDEASGYAVLRAASSGGGQRMLARGHRLKAGETGIVGYVAGQGEARLALDVGQDAHFFNNPDLPETRSEVALPLRVRGQVAGVLDVQSTEPAAFDEEDVAVLQVLADQVAMAIGNAQLFQQMEGSLAAERRAYGELSRQAWQELARTRPSLQRRYDPGGILPGGILPGDTPPGGDGWPEEMKRAVEGEKAVRAESGSSFAMAVPLKVRGRVIGVLDAHKPAGAGPWAEEEVDMLEALVDQLAVALEGARLYEETQRRAAREQLVSRVTSRMRETLDLETVLQTALREMGGALGLPRIEVRLGRKVPRVAGAPIQPSSDGTQAAGQEKEGPHAGLD